MRETLKGRLEAIQLAIPVMALLCLLTVSAMPSPAPPSDYRALREEAENAYAEGSYARARESYLKASQLPLTAAERRWASFRLADTLWRSLSSSNQPDPSGLEQALRELESFSESGKPEERDQIWAEAQESLGDYFWMRRGSGDWHRAWVNYSQALDWWAGSPDLEPARRRYIEIVAHAAGPGSREWGGYTYGAYGNLLPVEVLENALRISRSDEERAYHQYLLAMTLRHSGDGNQARRASEMFNAALESGARTQWHDDALFSYAEWLAGGGLIVRGPGGQWLRRPDYRAALEQFRRLTQLYQRGETRYFEAAERRIQELTQPVLGIGVDSIFLPGSLVQFRLSWRNLGRIDLVLSPIDLTADGDPSREPQVLDLQPLLRRLGFSPKEAVKSWSRETGDTGDHQPGDETVLLDDKLARGAYLLEASGRGQNRLELVLISDLVLTLNVSGKDVLAFVCDAGDGAPIPGARVRIFGETRETPSGRSSYEERTSSTDADGLAVFSLREGLQWARVFSVAALGDRQAFAQSQWYRQNAETGSWAIYTCTDRPAYRPGEEVQWKVTARTEDGGAYRTPSGETIGYEIRDPRGAVVRSGKLTLNAFGSAWESLPLTGEMPLGEYSVSFGVRRLARSSGVLFRLEEYKLPEFRVAVETPTEQGKKRTFRPGTPVEATVRAEYYFGGPVADADVEVVVFQRGFAHFWREPREFPWFYQQQGGYGNWRGQEVQRTSLRSGADGTVKVNIDTSRSGQQDVEYLIEARVTDASRREITGSGSIRVTRQSAFVYLHTAHSICKPQDRVVVKVKALDGNDQPVAARGSVTVTRDLWHEVWLDPRGKEVFGDELKALRGPSRSFPPPTENGCRPWMLKSQGYRSEEVLSMPLTLNAAGEAEFGFVPGREGYYRVSWLSDAEEPFPIIAGTAVWAATDTTDFTGYRSAGGLEIILDEDTVRAGATVPVMISSPRGARSILLTEEAETLLGYRVLRMTGDVKLVNLRIGEAHIPNFVLRAAAVSGNQMMADHEEVIVPPVEHYLGVEVSADRLDYRPQEEGSLTVTTRDHEGKPVAAEVALGLADESVFYIQPEYAPDPRQFFFGQKRPHLVSVHSTLHQRPYITLAARKEGTTSRGAAPIPQEGLRMKSSGRADFDAPQAAAAGMEEKMQFQMAAAAPAPMKKVSEAAEPSSEEPSVRVRTDFSSTAFWKPDVVTGTDGTAVVRVTFPDSLTTWRATARAVTTGSSFGTAAAAVRTRMPLIVRLQAPRFFVVGDTVTVSAVINNNTDAPLKVSPSMESQGLTLHSLGAEGEIVKREPGAVDIPAGGESRIDWTVSADRAGQARIRVAAKGGGYADAMERTYAVYEHGIEKYLTRSGKVGDGDLVMKMEIPRERRAEGTALTVQVAPSLAVTMLDALPYLADYPYGCTEQTMSRFLPAAVTAKTLRDLKLDPKSVQERIFGGIEPASGEKTHPGGRKDLSLLEDMIAAGLARLYDFQHADGGWGWWKEGESDHFMTAYVVWGLVLGRSSGVAVRAESMERAVSWLQRELVEEETNPDLQAWMLHALAGRRLAEHQQPGAFEEKAFDNVWAQRDALNAYTRALLAIAAFNYGKRDKALVLVRNLENGVAADSAPDTSVLTEGSRAPDPNAAKTAHWGNDGLFWRWSDGGVEATATALRALLAIDPGNRLVEPAVNWLIKNRRGAQWSNTRDTAMAVLALNDFLRMSGELSADGSYEVLVNGRTLVQKSFSAGDVLSAPTKFDVSRRLLRDGANEIRVRRRSGSGPLYVSARAVFFSLEDPVTAAGNEIFVRREYHRLGAKPTLLKGYVYERLPLLDGGRVTSGERVETVVTVEGKNNYEYLVFEDLKPGGFEAVEIRSGEPLLARELRRGEAGKGENGQTPPGEGDAARYTGRSRWVYQELRDRKVALFVDKLPEGIWEIHYELRAEVPGTFHAMPLVGHAMYVPEIRANGSEVRLTVIDRR